METNREKKNQQIVVLDRGWVYVGHTRRDGDVLHITDARCIRRWGTTRGLGQLAAEGPTSDTMLDPVGTAIAPWHAVITLIDCTTPW